MSTAVGPTTQNTCKENQAIRCQLVLEEPLAAAPINP